MSFIGNTLGKIVGGITGANQQADAIKSAAATQAQSAQAGITQENQALDAYKQLLTPYVTAGTGALTGQQNLLGLNGTGAQQSAIDALQTSPAFTAMQQQGNDAILANASATGGLRGGNVQSALAQFSPALLAQIIQQQYGNLGGITSIGANAASGVGSAGLNTSSAIAQLLQQQGAATAGGQVAEGSTARQAFSDMLKIGSTIAGFGGFGGGSGASYDAGAARNAASAAQSAPGMSGWNYAPAPLQGPSIPFLSQF